MSTSSNLLTQVHNSRAQDLPKKERQNQVRPQEDMEFRRPLLASEYSPVVLVTAIYTAWLDLQEGIGGLNGCHYQKDC